jgi:hypothetical protein
MLRFVAASTIASAISSAWAMCLAGSTLAACSKYATRSASGMADHHGVSTNPGDTAFTRRGASSAASGLTSPSTAALIAPTPAVPGMLDRAVIALTSVIEPSAARYGRTAWMLTRCVQNLASNARRSIVTSNSAIGPIPSAPLAATTRMSTVPIDEATALMAALSPASA